VGLLGRLFGKRAASREDCPYCRAEKPAFEVGGTPAAFGYPSVKFVCCGKVAFQYVDRKTGKFLRWIKIGDGQAEWLPKDRYFAYLEETAQPRGWREGSPHVAKGLTKPSPSSRAATAVTAGPPEAAPPSAPSPPPPSPAAPVAFAEVCSVSDVAPNTGKVVTVNGRRIALFHLGGQFHAIDDRCAHSGRSLGESVFEDDGFVTCNGHGWRYDVRTGATEHNPDAGVRKYAVKVEGGKVLVGA